MSRFNIDDILRDLGEPNPAAPVERVPGQAPQAAAPTEPASSAVQSPASAASSAFGATPAPVAKSAAGTASVSAGFASVSAPVSAPAAPVAAAAPTQASPAPAASPSSTSRSDDHGMLSDLYVPDDDAAAPAVDLDALLVERGIATAEQVLSVQRIQKQAPGRRVSELFKEQGADEHAVQAVVAELARMPFERIDAKSADAFDRAAFSRLGAEFCRANAVLPLRQDGARLVVATAGPDDVFVIDEVKRRIGITAVRHVLASAGDILGVLQHADEAHARAAADDFDIDAIIAGVDEEDVEVEKEDVNERDIEAEAESSPVVKYVNHIIRTALQEGASDIHIEPDEKVLKVRFRIDGVLFEMMSPPRKMHAALTSRIKIMSNLDIAERRLPQDGRIRATVLGRKLDLRVSTVPTPKGEKTVMRILDSRSISVSLDDLGFSEDALTIWKKQIDQPHGILLVTGPTGSGKTTTLYSSIRQMDTRRMNVSTVEDPIEYNLAGITQIQTHDKIGMTFAKALKALLRQDPDVVMLGEIRDLETAATAIQAALTGHLVLSTLHTNDAPSSITRLINIGVEPFLVGAALNGVLAQRLVRRICPKCVADQPIPDDMREFVAMHGIHGDTMRLGRGCAACRQTGYTGRLGLYELLVLDDFLRDKIAGNPNVVEFRRLCIERGMATLREDGFAKVRQGRTTIEEVLSVTEATI